MTLVPYVVEKSGREERVYDIYSRLLKDRIVFLGTQVNDEVANSIDLDAAERRMVATERQTVEQKRRAPSYFEYRPAPLRVTWEAPPLPVGASSTSPSVDLVMYDFGAVSLSFAIPIAGPFGDLVALKGVVKYPIRIKCAVLAWDVFQEAVRGSGEAAAAAPHA